MKKKISHSFDRLIKVIGEDNFNTLSNKKVLVLGCGGVGGFVIEALVRSGIGSIVLIDSDKIEESNLNRQIVTDINNIGEAKVDAWRKRILDINPECKVEVINSFIDESNIKELFSSDIDYYIDTEDTVKTKEIFIEECLKRKVKFIVCTGTGNRIDPSKLEIKDIRKTSYDPLARIIRKYVNDNKIRGKINVLCSNEKPVKTDGEVGSTIFVPASAGLMIASFVLRDK
ncbi:MAG: ThiF family adenylyltransferase [Bacilli bacterium]|nr:ThiF family adenylyltransferase [Bacilli bacterium]